MRVETRRSVLEQQRIRVAASSGQNRKGSRPGLPGAYGAEAERSPENSITLCSANPASASPRRTVRPPILKVTRNGSYETNCSRRLPLDHQAEFRVGSGAPPRRCRHHDRCAPYSCRSDATPKVGSPGPGADARVVTQTGRYFAYLDHVRFRAVRSEVADSVCL